MNKNIFLKLFILISIAFLFRIWFLDKPEGLWNDEYVAWFISSQNTFQSFIAEILKNCHMPLYYIYLKLWLFIFPDTDMSLRISSVVCSLASVFMMYKAGKEYKDEKTGLLSALFCAVSSFLIYFAQEVRIYSLLFLISSFSLFAWLKCLKDFSLKNYSLLLLSNVLLILTHTIGICFVFFSFMTLIIAKLREKSLPIKKCGLYIIPYVIITILISPFLYKLFVSGTLSQFWSGFNWSKIYYIFNDYFTPIQINILNTPQNLFLSIVNKHLNYGFIIFSIIPLALSVAAVIKAVTLKDKVLNLYALICFMFFSTLVIASMMGKIVLITKYSIEIYPFLILALSAGILSLKQVTSVIIGGLILFLNVTYLVFSPISAPKLTRPEGNFAPVALIEQSGLNKNDIVVLTYYDKHLFERYLQPDKYTILEITKYTYPYYLFSQTPEDKNIIRDNDLKYIDFFRKNDIKYFNSALQNEIFSKMKSDSKVAFIFLNTVSFYTEDKIKSISENEKEYAQTPFIFLAFSYLKNNLIEQASKNNMKLDVYLEAGEWTLISFERAD